MKVIAYTYDADYHCVDCTNDMLSATNLLEHDEPYPIYDIDEWYANALYLKEPKAVLACGTCHEIIEEIDLSY